MTVTVMRKTFKKMHPRVINYRSYRDFYNEIFRVYLINNLANEFLLTVMMMSYKNFAKRPWTRSRLKNKYLKHKTEENRLLYTQQRNKCVYLLRKTKMNYYGNLNEKDITESKDFLENC